MPASRYRVAHVMPWAAVGGTEQATLRIARATEGAGFGHVMFCRRDDRPTSEELATEALNDLRESYPQIESDPGSTQIAGRMTHGYDVRFFLFDLTNSCWIRTFQTDTATMLVMWQINDLETENHELVLRAIWTSLRVE